jgi:hypothetical protein
LEFSEQSRADAFAARASSVASVVLEPATIEPVPSEADEAAHAIANPIAEPWSPFARLAFRIVFLYFFCFLFFLGNGTPFDLFPVVGDWIDGVLTWPFNHLSEWTGEHLFHLTGLAAHWHPTGSGDTTLNWILNGLFIAFSLAGGLVWTLVAMLRGNRRKEYKTMYAWLRFGLRISCGAFMLNYGLAKVFPFQMAPISVGILNEPVGNMSPMTFLWALIGMNPIYEIICGAAEVIGGILLFYRRTALLGALISAFVMTNVVLYNFFFDVPVKIFAVNLLMALIFLTVEDMGALLKFFWLHKAVAPAATWIPPSRKRWYRITLLVVEWVFCLGFLIMMPIQDGIGWFQTVKAEQERTPLVGSWKIDTAHLPKDVFITGDGLPASDLYIDNAVRAFTRATDGALWRTRLKLDAKAHTMRIDCFPSKSMNYSYQMPDNDHLMLTATAPEDAKPEEKAKFQSFTLALKRTPTLAHYPLLDRGFHYVNQWGLER